MIRIRSILALTALLTAFPAYADVQELSQRDIRRAVADGEIKSLSSVLATVEDAISGKTIDVRAFDADGLIYSVLVMAEDGTMAFVLIDGNSGRIVPQSSARAKRVLETAASTKGPNNAASRANKSNGKGKGNNGKGKGKGKGN